MSSQQDLGLNVLPKSGSGFFTTNLKEAIDEDGAGVDHRQFVHQLHLVLEGHVEHPGTDANGQEEDVGHSEPVQGAGF